MNHFHLPGPVPPADLCGTGAAAHGSALVMAREAPLGDPDKLPETLKMPWIVF